MTARSVLPFLVAAVLGLSAVLVSGCSDGQASGGAAQSQAPERSVPRVETLVLTPTSFEDRIEVTGSVEALNDAVLSAQAPGTITEMVARGARLSDGAIVAQIDPAEEAAAVEQARAQFELAEDRLERQRPLYQDSIISPLEFEQIRSDYTRAKAALAQAEQRLANTRVRTPFAGTVEERFVEPGEQINTNEPVARVVDTRRVRVAAGIPERYANDIEVGTSVQLDFRRYGGTVRTAPVTFVGRAIDADTRTFPIEVEVDNRDGRLKPEMVARLRVTRSRLDSAIVVPRTAVVRDEAGTHAYVAAPRGSAVVAEKRTLTLGPSHRERTVVEAGLQAGDAVLVAGQNNVAPGDTVRVATQYDGLDAAGTPFEGDTTSAPPRAPAAE